MSVPLTRSGLVSTNLMAEVEGPVIEDSSGVDKTGAFQVVVEHWRCPDASRERDRQFPYVYDGQRKQRENQNDRQ